MLPDTIPLMFGRVQQMDLDGKKYDALPVIIVGVQWDGETLKQMPSELLVKTGDVKVSQIAAGYANVIIDDLATLLKVPQEEIKNYFIVVRPSRALAPGDMSSDDDIDIRIEDNSAGEWGKNTKIQDQYGMPASFPLTLALNEYNDKVTGGSGSWAGGETFNWVVNYKIYKLSVGTLSREVIAEPGR